MKTIIEHLVNHIVLVVDESGSMAGQPVATVVDTELKNLRQQSLDMRQETRISIYTFSYAGNITCIVWDMDVMRFETIAGMYHPDGQTALIDATLQAILDNKTIPTKYGDHAFLIYVITDGQENNSRSRSGTLVSQLQTLPDNWTLACLVPDANGVYEAKKYGFPKESIATWNTQSKTGFEEVGKQFSRVTSNYMTMRSTGVRGTKGLFTIDAGGLKKSKLDPVDFSYEIFEVPYDGRIDETVERFTHRPYAVGSTFYEPMKTVKIQDYKLILAMNMKSGQVYGGDNIRELLGLPPQTVEVNPSHHRDWKIFVQSTSLNRKLFGGTQILVRKDY